MGSAALEAAVAEARTLVESEQSEQAFERLTMLVEALVHTRATENIAVAAVLIIGIITAAVVYIYDSRAARKHALAIRRLDGKTDRDRPRSAPLRPGATLAGQHLHTLHDTGQIF
jgi:hypothetical protein